MNQRRDPPAYIVIEDDDDDDEIQVTGHKPAAITLQPGTTPRPRSRPAPKPEIHLISSDGEDEIQHIPRPPVASTSKSTNNSRPRNYDNTSAPKAPIAPPIPTVNSSLRNFADHLHAEGSTSNRNSSSFTTKRRQSSIPKSSVCPDGRKKPRVDREPQRALVDEPPLQPREVDSDSEEGYTYHAGYDMVSGNWEPAKGPLFVMEEEDKKNVSLPDQQAVTPPQVEHPRNRMPKLMTREMVRHKSSWQPAHPKGKTVRIWDVLAHSRGVRDMKRKPPKTLSPSFIRPLAARRYKPNLFLDLSYHTLKLVRKHKAASGATTKIMQGPAIVAVASAASGGSSDSTNGRSEPDAYNREGNLLVWKGEAMIPFNAHDASWSTRTTRTQPNMQDFQKFYTVNDLAFDPQDPNRFVSSGNDRYVCSWSIGNGIDGNYEMKNAFSTRYPDVPSDLAFRQNSSHLAVACHDGSIYLHPDLRTGVHHRIPVVPGIQDPLVKTGAFVWGDGNSLFASTESDVDDVACHHVAIDVEQSRVLYKFLVTESGDAMALDPLMKRLALVTSTQKHHTLGIYDVGAGKRHPVHSVKLRHPTVTGMDAKELEVLHASFSPDGIFLALARSDDIISVYDTRFMEKAVYTFKQPGNSYTNYGVVSAEWVYGPRGGGLGLITGGSDGCVRLWDTRLASEDVTNGRKLFQVDNGIACMSIGDPVKGHHRFVVGDEGGSLYFYD